MSDNEFVKVNENNEPEATLETCRTPQRKFRRPFHVEKDDRTFYAVHLDSELYGYCKNLTKIKSMMRNFFEKEKVPSRSYHTEETENSMTLISIERNAPVVYDKIEHTVKFSPLRFMA